MKISNTTHEAYIQALKDVWYEPDYRSSPRGQPTREIVDYTFKVLRPTTEPIRTADEARNNTIASYTAKEVELYDSGTNDVADFAKASKFWNKLANPDGTVNSAYGHLIWYKNSHGSVEFEDVFRTPWDWCVESLKRDKDTRQAILRFSLPEHFWFGNKDQVCTLHGNFLIRDDKLHLSVIMRSNDLMRGLVYDLPWFVSLQDRMIADLKEVYPNLEKGHYTHTAHSMHIYERDEETILKMIGE